MISKELISLTKISMLCRALKSSKLPSDIIGSLIFSNVKHTLAYAFILSIDSIEKIGNYLAQLNDSNMPEKTLSFVGIAKNLGYMKDPTISRELLMAANTKKDTESYKKILEMIDKPSEEMYYLAIDTAFKSLKVEQALAFYSQCTYDSNYEICQLMVSGLSKFQLVNQALEFYNRIRGMNLLLNSETTLSLLECCIKKENLKEAINIFTSQKDTLNIQCYKVYVKGLSKYGDLEQAISILNKMKELFDHNECPYYCIIERLAKEGDLPRAFQYLVEAKNKNAKIQSNTYDTLIEAYLAIGNLPKAWDLIDDMKNNNLKPNSHTYTLVFKAIKGNKTDLLKASELLKSLEDDNDTEPDVILYNILLDNFVSNRMLTNACELLDRMEVPENRIMPDVISYNTVIKGCSQIRNSEKAYSLFIRMKNSFVNPNEVTYNSLIDAYVRCGDLKSACKLLPAMEASGLIPDNFTYSTLIKGVSPRNHVTLKKAFELFNEMKRNNQIKPDEILYNCLIDACVRFKDTYRAVSVFKEMELENVEPSSITYGILIKAYGQSNQLDNAFRVFSKMKSEGCVPNDITYGCLIDACVRSRSIKKAHSTYENMLRDGIKPNTVIYTTLIKGFTQTKNLEGAIKIYDKMKKDPTCQPNNITYNSLLDCCTKCNDLNKLKDIFTEMQTAGRRPDLITFTTIIKGYCRNEDLPSALKMLELMEKMYIKPDEVLLNLLLEGCVTKGELEIGLEVFYKITNSGVNPSNLTYSILMKIYEKGNISPSKIVTMEKCNIIDLLKILMHENLIKDTVEILDKINVEVLKLGKYTYIELIDQCMKYQSWNNAAIIAIKSLTENPEYARSEYTYKALISKLTEIGSDKAADISDLMCEKIDKDEHMFRPLTNIFNNVTQDKIKRNYKSEKGDFTYTKSSFKRNNNFIKYKEESKSELNHMKQAEKKLKSKHFSAKPIDFSSGLITFKNSKMTENKTGKNPRLI